MKLWSFYAIIYNKWRLCWPLCQILNREKINLKKLLTLLPQEEWDICDIGSGVGHSLDLVTKSRKMIAVDVTFKMAQILHQKGLTVIVADGLQLPFQAGSFSLIQVIGVSEYIHDLSLLFRELSRIGQARLYILFTSSPLSMITLARYLTGHKIYPRKFHSVVTLASSLDYQLIGHTNTISQEAYLFKWEKNDPSLSR
jgi:ubiquinone/menaquinone biosynthesis C-methylase UbiE